MRQHCQLIFIIFYRCECPMKKYENMDSLIIYQNRKKNPYIQLSENSSWSTSIKNQIKIVFDEKEFFGDMIHDL